MSQGLVAGNSNMGDCVTGEACKGLVDQKLQGSNYSLAFETHELVIHLINPPAPLLCPARL